MFDRVKFTLGNIKVPCSTHGDRLEVMIEHEDHLEFRHVIRVCEGCLDDALEAYLGPGLVCVECGLPAPKGLGIEKDGKFVSLCLACQGKRLAGSIVDG